MTDLEESQRVTVERLQKEIEVWKTKYYDQIKTDEDWERYIEKSREEAQKLSKQKAISWVLGFLWILLVIYEIFF
jgi:tRNA U34 5-carboxymethylaminomethyl modifying enzyme MnmG/GidA